MSIVSTTVEYTTHTCVELIKTYEAKYVFDFLIVCMCTALQHQTEQNNEVQRNHVIKTRFPLLQGITVIIAG